MGMIRAIVIGMVVAALPISAASQAPVAHWRFDESAGPVAFDAAGEHHGFVSGSVTLGVAGVDGGAIQLARSGSGHVNFGDILNFQGASFSIALWMRSTDTADDNCLASRHQAGFPNGYLLCINQSGAGGAYGGAGKAWFAISDFTPGAQPVSTTTINDGLWHHIVLVHEIGVSTRIHVDGLPAEDSRVLGSMSAPQAPFVIGGVTYATPTGTYDGLIDDVQVYDRVLADAEIQFLLENAGTPLGRASAKWAPWLAANGGNGNFYRVVPFASAIRWTHARSAATDLAGHLATLTSAGENTFVHGLLADARYWSIADGRSFGPWIGASDETTEGDFRWISGEPWSFTAWAAGQPDNAGDEDYVQYFGPTPDQPATWGDSVNIPAVSSATLAFAAESEFRIAAAAERPQTGNRYFLVSRQDGSGLTWLAADRLARELGTHLADIADAAENAWLWQTFGDGENRHLWIGLNDRKTEGDYRWTSRAAVTYTNWYVGEPNNLLEEDGVFLLSTQFGSGGFWNDGQLTATSYGNGQILALIEFEDRIFGSGFEAAPRTP
jgi:hypothetical protein